ncbi:hypothetical protein ABKN59_009078 [Abortiporus biennis]
MNHISTQKFSFNDLPDDLIEYVADLIEDDDLRCFKNASLVCTSWKLPFQKRLFRKFRFDIWTDLHGWHPSVNYARLPYWSMNSTLRRMVQICTVTVQLSTLQLEGVSDLEQNEVPSYQVPSYPDMSELEIAPILVILMAATLVIFPNINNLAFTSTTSDKTYAIDHSSESESALLVIPLHQLKELTCSDRGSDEQQTFSSFSEGLKEIFTTAKTLTTVILEITDADIRTATARYLLDAFKSIKNLTLVEPEGYNGRLMDEGVTSGNEFSVFEGDRLSQLESLHYGIKRSKWINIDHEVPWNHEIFEKTLIPCHATVSPAATQE